ncbi:hypothetical protein LXA43DRAFT_1154470 [Ganoderma leucocontextum]|nr:hypothetical protein LXA43DRAFT_1154470 [Ganoderma leucocontextum]
MRPEPPQSRIWSQQLKTEILYQCWHHSPMVRPSFAKVEHDVQELWAHYGPDLKESSAPLVWETEDMAVAIIPPVTLPLWDPSPIAIRAVGYHSKHDGKGSFKTLFNSFSPRKSSNGRTGDMPSIQHYGQISTREQRQEPEPEQQDRKVGAQLSRMNVTQSQLVSTGDREGEARYSYRYSSPLRRGHKTAHLITESTNYRYLEDLSMPGPKRWFQDNADRILGIYGEEHCISKEDLYLGTSFVPFAIS